VLVVASVFSYGDSVLLETPIRTVYDARGRRIRKLLGADPEDPDAAYDYYYSGRQVVEVRKDSNAHPYEQYVWDGRHDTRPVLDARRALPAGTAGGGCPGRRADRDRAGGRGGVCL